MLSISAIAGGGSDYYLKDLDSTSAYYLNDNSQTYWSGGAKEALGLKNDGISKEDFDRLMAGHVPGGQRIGNPCKENGWKHDPGRDFTFSDPKSVSILLQGPLRPKILQSKKRAIEKAMSYGQEHFAETRIRGEIIGKQKMVWAVINEDTSRANDPNGHAHVVLFNMVQGEDGKFRAMRNHKFYDNQVLMGQIYRAELAKDLKEMGFRIEPVGKHGQWEIEEVSEDIRESFSTRRQAILAQINPKNDTAEAREKICLITRPSKQNIVREKLLETWASELKAYGTSFEKLSTPSSQTPQMAPWSLTARVKTTSNIIAETEPHLGEHVFLRRVMDRTNGHFTIDQVKNEVNRQIEKGTLVRSKDGEYLARSIDLRREKQVFKEAAKGYLKSKPLLSEKQYQDTIKNTTLKDDQKRGIRLLTRSLSRYTKIQGDAGTGKSFALETAVPAIKSNGFKVIGLSTTSKSTELLKQTGVFDKVMTFQKYLLVPEGDKKTVLIIDEASMIGRDDMLSLLRFTNQKQLRHVLFQGDENQMSGVKAGMPFRDLEKSGVRSIVMNEIIRQKEIRQRKGITQLTRGNIKKAFEVLKPEFQEVPQDKMTEYALKAWRASGDLKTPIIIQTNRQKNDINAAIKSEHLRQNPGAKHLTLKTWQTVYKTDTEKQFVEGYQDATHIRFNRTYKRLGISRGDMFKLEGINHKKAQLSLSRKGQRLTFRPAQYKMGEGAVELYRQEVRTLHEGDRIRFTRGGHRQPVNNNQCGTIKAISNGKVTFELDKKTAKTLTLTKNDTTIRHIDHAWASTAHAVQGETVDHAVVVMPSRKSPLTTLESLYTGASRHRLSLTIITDDAKRLVANIQEKLQLKALEANIQWPEAELDNEPIAEQKDVQEHSGLLSKLGIQRRTSNQQQENENSQNQEPNSEQKLDLGHEEEVSMGM